MIPLYDIISLKYSDAIFGVGGNVQLGDYGLGNGPEIIVWELNESQPTVEELAMLQTDPTILSAYTLEQNIITNAPIIAQLDALDAKSIRALRTNDTVRLADLEAQAVTLRAQLVH